MPTALDIAREYFPSLPVVRIQCKHGKLGHQTSKRCGAPTVALLYRAIA